MNAASESLVKHVIETAQRTSSPLWGLWCGGSFFRDDSLVSEPPHDIDILAVGVEKGSDGIIQIQSFTTELMKSLRCWRASVGRPIFLVPRFEVLAANELVAQGDNPLFVHYMPFATLRSLSDFHPKHITRQIIEDGLGLLGPDNAEWSYLLDRGHTSYEYPTAFLMQMLVETWVMLASDLGKHRAGYMQCRTRLRYIAKWSPVDIVDVERLDCDPSDLEAVAMEMLDQLRGIRDVSKPIK